MSPNEEINEQARYNEIVSRTIAWCVVSEETDDEEKETKETGSNSKVTGIFRKGQEEDTRPIIFFEFTRSFTGGMHLIKTH